MRGDRRVRRQIDTKMAKERRATRTVLESERVVRYNVTIDDVSGTELNGMSEYLCRGVPLSAETCVNNKVD